MTFHCRFLILSAFANYDLRIKPSKALLMTATGLNRLTKSPAKASFFRAMTKKMPNAYYGWINLQYALTILLIYMGLLDPLKIIRNRLHKPFQPLLTLHVFFSYHPPPYLCHYLAPRCGQNNADRKTAAVRRRDSSGRRGPSQIRRPERTLGLDGN